MESICRRSGSNRDQTVFHGCHNKGQNVACNRWEDLLSLPELIAKTPTVNKTVLVFWLWWLTTVNHHNFKKSLSIQSPPWSQPSIRLAEIREHLYVLTFSANITIWEAFLTPSPDSVEADVTPLKERSEWMLYRANIYLKPADWVSQMSDVFSY